MLDKLFSVCQGQRQGMDEMDLEAERAGNAIRAFREYKMERMPTRSANKRKITRGKIGADARKGMMKVS